MEASRESMTFEEQRLASWKFRNGPFNYLAPGQVNQTRGSQSFLQFPLPLTTLASSSPLSPLLLRFSWSLPIIIFITYCVTLGDTGITIKQFPSFHNGVKFRIYLKRVMSRLNYIKMLNLTIINKCLVTQ